MWTLTTSAHARSDNEGKCSQLDRIEGEPKEGPAILDYGFRFDEPSPGSPAIAAEERGRMNERRQKGRV